MAALPAYACAVANLAAVVALATVLAPGTTLVDETTRVAYVNAHLLAWRVGWALWVVAAASLLFFYRWWSARVRAGPLPLAVALVGFAADLTAETLLIAVVPDHPELARPAFVLTGAVANVAYTIAGILLTVRTPSLAGSLRAWTWTVWLAGLVLGAFALFEIPLGIAALSAVLFALFLPWLVVAGRRLA